MQSIPPRKKHCCRNARSHGGSKGFEMAFSMDMGKLAYQNKQTARMRLYARREECFLLQWETLATVATVPVTLSLPLVAGRLGRPSRTIAAFRQ